MERYMENSRKNYSIKSTFNSIRSWAKPPQSLLKFLKKNCDLQVE